MDDDRPNSAKEKPTAEELRLEEDREKKRDWRRWGPYLAERQWGTVREDYSADGSAWSFFTHDQSRSRAYRWGEDGIGGFSDYRQYICLSLAMWNERDPILKERLFGLTGQEGNHGEDVKEVYFYLDATPTHSYLRMLYKYPQAEFPYAQLVEENRKRGKDEPEYEITDTGVFDAGKYFDIEIEYAKADADDCLMRVRATNRGRESAPLHLMPQVTSRNNWSWDHHAGEPSITRVEERTFKFEHPNRGVYFIQFREKGETLFTNNETNAAKIFGIKDAQGYFKDGFHEFVVSRNRSAVNPEMRGTKAAMHLKFDVPAGKSVEIQVRISREQLPKPFEGSDKLFAKRIKEADAFYDKIQKDLHGDDARSVQRQAFAGMIWSKQFYRFNVREWLFGDMGQVKPPESRRKGRNRDWLHIDCADVLSMPDKWEYPWFAAWDLAFHCIPFAMIDPEFAKQQLILLTREWFMHPNGQLPAYEWQFGDVNPPVHAWAAWRVFQLDRDRTGKADHAFLERVFHKLLLNFTWWVNRKDAEGRNIFQGGFLGLDNIGVFDRSAPLPTGGYISQSDGTSWMAMYSLNLMRIALELSLQNPVYEDVATKFFEHFLGIAAAAANVGGEGIDLWNEEDEFFYDVLSLPTGEHKPLKVRSMVGLIPLFAVEVLDSDLLDKVPEFTARLQWIFNNRPELAKLVSRWNDRGQKETHLLSLLRGHRMKCLLRRMLDETEFLSEFGVRAVSRYHKEHPYVFKYDSTTTSVGYEPGESTSGLFGGNSNWRGPIWMPVNYLLIESLRRFHDYYGDEFKIECPVGSGQKMTIEEAANELTRRLTQLFLKDANGRRPVLGDCEVSQKQFGELVPLYEYFHGDTGRGVGASHQTGWTGLIAHLLSTIEHPEGRESRVCGASHVTG